MWHREIKARADAQIDEQSRMFNMQVKKIMICYFPGELVNDVELLADQSHI